MNVTIADIRALLERVLTQRGLSQEDAAVLANDYLEGELQGKASHGLMAFPSLAKKLPMDLEEPEVIKQTGSAIFVDAKKNFGALVGRQYAAKAIELAKEQGIAMVLIKNMLSWLRPASIAQFIAEQNMIGLVTNNGGRPMMAAPGGVDPTVGTNPMGIGVPVADHNLVIDMATSKRAWGEVRKAELDGTDLPTETYLDTSGEFTLDHAQAHAVVGAGGYKGYALGLLIEILSGSLIDMPMNNQGAKGENYRTLTRGATILVIDPAFSTDINRFEEANRVLTDQIRSGPKRPGVEEIFLPGDRAAANKKNALERGKIEIDDGLWDTLQALDNTPQ